MEWLILIVVLVGGALPVIAAVIAEVQLKRMRKPQERSDILAQGTRVCPTCGGRAKNYCGRCGAKITKNDSEGWAVLPRDSTNLVQVAPPRNWQDVIVSIAAEPPDPTDSVRARHPNVFRDHLK